MKQWSTPKSWFSHHHTSLLVWCSSVDKLCSFLQTANLKCSRVFCQDQRIQSISKSHLQTPDSWCATDYWLQLEFIKVVKPHLLFALGLWMFNGCLSARQEVITVCYQLKHILCLLFWFRKRSDHILWSMSAKNKQTKKTQNMNVELMGWLTFSITVQQQNAEDEVTKKCSVHLFWNIIKLFKMKHIFQT